MMRLDSVPVVDDHSHVGLAEYRDNVSVRPLRKELRGPSKATDGHRTTANAILLRQTCAEIYGAESAEDDFEAASNHARRNGPGSLWAEMLNLSNTRTIIADTPVLDRELYPLPLYRRAARFDVFLYPFGRPDVYPRGGDPVVMLDECMRMLQETLSNQHLTGLPDRLEGYLEVVKKAFEGQAKDVVCFKVVSAYMRSLEFTAPSTREAAKTYADLASGKQAHRKMLEDYLMRYMMGLARNLGKPVQFHTGFSNDVTPGDSGVPVNNGNQLQLESLLADKALRGAKIVLMHGAYPFGGQAACLVHNFDNAYLDFSWLPLLFHGVLARWLREWLEFLPSSKLVFGSDTGTPEVQVAAVRNAKRSVEIVLSNGVSEKLWSAREATLIADRVFHENACNLYGFSLP